MNEFQDEVHQFDQQCVNAWGAPTRSVNQLLSYGHRNLAQIQELVAFDKASDALKIHIAEKLILESSPRVGAFAESGDVTWFLYNFAREFSGKLGRDGIFEGRRLLPLKSALLLTVKSEFGMFVPPGADDIDYILKGGGALAALYLLAQLEFLFRMKSRYLNGDGKVIHPIPLQLAAKWSGKKKIKVGKRINQIKQAFISYLYRNRDTLAWRLRRLENRIAISGRLGRIRNPAMHGPLGDPAVEGQFYGLLLSMFYHDERQKVD